VSEAQNSEQIEHQRPSLRNEVIADALLDQTERRRMGLLQGDDESLPVVIEVNLQHAGGLTGAVNQLRAEWATAGIGGSPPSQTADIYCHADLTIRQVQDLVAVDLKAPDPSNRAIYRVWPDFPIRPLIDKSCSTVKADAARRSYGADGSGIVWAVIDSGIDERHLHFDCYDTLRGEVEGLHRDFTQPDVFR